MAGWVALGAVVVASLCFGLVWQRRNGRLRGSANGAVALSPEMLAALGVPRGERATLVQFTSAFCAPCRATRRILGDVAEMVPGVAYGEIDAESNLDLVRRFNVLRTPTVFVLDADGRLVRRASGQPRNADVIAALGMLVDA